MVKSKTQNKEAELLKKAYDFKIDFTRKRVITFCIILTLLVITYSLIRNGAYKQELLEKNIKLFSESAYSREFLEHHIPDSYKRPYLQIIKYKAKNFFRWLFYIILKLLTFLLKVLLKMLFKSALGGFIAYFFKTLLGIDIGSLWASNQTSTLILDIIVVGILSSIVLDILITRLVQKSPRIKSFLSS